MQHLVFQFSKSFVTYVTTNFFPSNSMFLIKVNELFKFSPLFSLRIVIILSHSSSIVALNFFKAFEAFDFSLRKKNHNFYEKSLTTCKRYPTSKNDGVIIRPQIFACLTLYFLSKLYEYHQSSCIDLPNMLHISLPSLELLIRLVTSPTCT